MSVDESDLALLHRWRSGDVAAGNRLVRRHYHRVRQFFATKLDDGVDDLTQQTFLACTERRQVIEQGRFVAFLLAIARNKLLHCFRHRGRHQARLDPLTTSVADLATSSGIVVRGQRKRSLVSALRELPIDAQIALELFYWEELSIAEIAAVLEVPSGTVKARLSRARAALKVLLAAHEEPQARAGRASCAAIPWDDDAAATSVARVPRCAGGGLARV